MGKFEGVCARNADGKQGLPPGNLVHLFAYIVKSLDVYGDFSEGKIKLFRQIWRWATA